MENLIEVGEVRKETPDEHHDICLALVVKLKDKMKKEGLHGLRIQKEKRRNQVRSRHNIR